LGPHPAGKTAAKERLKRKGKPGTKWTEIGSRSTNGGALNPRGGTRDELSQKKKSRADTKIRIKNNTPYWGKQKKKGGPAKGGGKRNISRDEKTAGSPSPRTTDRGKFAQGVWHTKGGGKTKLEGSGGVSTEAKLTPARARGQMSSAWSNKRRTRRPRHGRKTAWGERSNARKEKEKRKNLKGRQLRFF